MLEEGYMTLDVIREGNTIAVIYANIVRDRPQFTMYVGQGDTEEEYHIESIEKAIEILRTYAGPLG
jgi:hypothetical protein